MSLSIVEQFRAAPPGTLYGVHGDSSVFRLALIAAGYTLLQGVPVTLVDGSNRFDLYGLAEFARRTAGGRCTPDELLRNIFISRAFTCYQMEAVIAERLRGFVRDRKSTVVLIFGLLDTFYDEQAPLRDVRLGVQRMMQALQGLKRDGVSVLVASTDVGPVPPARRGLLPGVMGGMDKVFDMGKQGRGQKEEGKSLPAAQSAVKAAVHSDKDKTQLSMIMGQDRRGEPRSLVA